MNSVELSCDQASAVRGDEEEWQGEIVAGARLRVGVSISVRAVVVVNASILGPYRNQTRQQTRQLQNHMTARDHRLLLHITLDLHFLIVVSFLRLPYMI
jgi:hypothetical protein